MCADFSARMPLATWNPARGVWETTRVALCGHSAVFSETWPISGSMRAGVAYGPPTSVPLTDGSGSSSSPGLLLGTPRCSDGMQGQLRTGVANTKARLEDQVSLLPTPTASDRFGAGSHGEGGPDLRTTVSLFPTPTAGNFNDG